MDKCPVRRYADLSVCTLLQQHRHPEAGLRCLPPVASGECVVPLRISPRLLHPAASLRFQMASCCPRLGDVGILQLFPHHHRCRTSVESDGSCLSAADDRRHSACLSRAICGGLCRHCPFRRDGDSCQPCADDILLYDHHHLYGGGISRREHTREADAAFLQSHGGMRRRSGTCRHAQSLQPLSHMGVSERIDARQERTCQG